MRRGAIARAGAVLAAAAGLLLPAAAQKAGPVAPPPFMLRPPAVGPVPTYTPPASVRDQLPNGLRIVVVRDARFPLVTAELAVRGGSSLLTPAEAGLAEAEAKLLTAGTPTLNARQIAYAADSLGGSISGSADKDFLTVHASSLATNAERMFALLADVALRPTFPESEVALRKANMEQELRLERSEPDFLARVQFYQLLYGDNPYAITAPTEASIAAISRAKLAAYHQRVFLPNNDATLVIVGDISEGLARSLAQRYFGDWTFGSPPAPRFPPPPARPGRRIYLVDRPGSAQSVILLGNLGLERTAADYFPFLVANEVLGGSFNSRLVSDIREAKGYAYDIASFNRPLLDGGAWQVVTEVRTAVTAPALAATLAQLDRIREAAVSGTELEQAKNYLAGSFARHLETQAAVATEFLTVEEYGLPRDYLARFVPRAQAVNAAAALAAAREHIRPDRALVVVVGDAHRIEASLTRYTSAPISIYNETGHFTGLYPPSGIRHIVKP